MNELIKYEAKFPSEDTGYFDIEAYRVNGAKFNSATFYCGSKEQAQECALFILKMLNDSILLKPQPIMKDPLQLFIDQANAVRNVEIEIIK